MNKPYLIIAATDANCGDFVVDHWYRSLRENVALEEIDVAICDFGLSVSHREQLSQVTLIPSVKDGRVSNIRFREILRFLEATDYAQVLSVDCGDVIFQNDISHLFDVKNTAIHMLEESSPGIQELFYEGIREPEVHEIREFLQGKNMLNVGFVVAPTAKMKKLCSEVLRLTEDLDAFGPDQIIVDYLAYKDSFQPLERDYNFLLVDDFNRFTIRNGFFYNAQGHRISVVHNAGRFALVRKIINFGYGTGHNRPNYLLSIVRYFLYLVYRLSKLFGRDLRKLKVPDIGSVSNREDH